jgi:hypothetical protein
MLPNPTGKIYFAEGALHIISYEVILASDVTDFIKILFGFSNTTLLHSFDTNSFKDMLQIFSSQRRVKVDQKMDSRRCVTLHRHRLPRAMCCCYIYSSSIHSTKELGDHVANTSTHFKHPNRR